MELVSRVVLYTGVTPDYPEVNSTTVVDCMKHGYP